MKIHLILTEDWKEMKEAIPVAQKYLSIFGISITSERKNADVSSEFLYETTKSWGGLTQSETKSLKPGYIFGLASIDKAQSADCIGIICDKAKTIAKVGLHGQQATLGTKQIIEVYGVKKREGTYGFTSIAYTLIHELFHALADFYKVEDTLHTYLSKNKTSLNEYKDILFGRTLKTTFGMLPLVEQKANMLITYAKEHGLDIRITEGYRSPERQDKLYKQKPKVTNAKAWESMHQYRVAFDIVFTKLGYNATNVQWNVIASYAKMLGFSWGGDWKGFVDKPHFELTFGKTLQDFQLNNIDWTKYTSKYVYDFKKDLSYGMTHPDVKTLQHFLNTHGFILTKQGAGSPGNETEYFGELTQRSLAKYQTDQKILPANGYLGPITRSRISLTSC